jgi:hypothetical protein
MWRDETKPDDSGNAGVGRTKGAPLKTASGWNVVLLSTPECATEQMEHSWPGSLEFSACTWIACTTPVKATNQIHSQDRAATCLPLRDLYPIEFKIECPKLPILL